MLAANVLAGVLNYLFQVRAAAQLDAASYGALNGWMTYLSVALFAGGTAQMASNFLPASPRLLRRVSMLTILVTCAALAWLFRNTLTSASASPSPLDFGIACTALGILQQWMLGQLQTRTWFAWMGSSLVLTALVKWSGPTLSPFAAMSPRTAYFWAFPLSYGVACLFQSIVVLAQPPAMSSVHPQPGMTASRRPWMHAITLALAMALLPQLDMLNLRALQADYELGLFARAALFAKAIFFGALTLLQVALPYHLRWKRGECDANEYARVRRLERLGIAACVVGSFACALCAPWIASRFLGFELSSEHRLWVLLSCLSLTTLYGHLQAVQVHCATGEWRRAAARLAAVALLYPIAQAIGHNVSVSVYLAIACTYYMTMELAARLLATTGVTGRAPRATG